jgi:hypothetical protein
MLFRTLALPALIGVSHLNAVAVGQTEDPVSIEVQAHAVRHLRVPKIERIDRRHQDGVRGYKITSATRYATANPEHRKRVLRNIACNAVVFGIAKLETTQSFVGKDGDGVFTLFRFRLLEDWHALPDRNVDTDVQLVIEGGETSYKGEAIRVENALADYQVGSSYLLVAGSRFNSNDGNILYEQSPLIKVADDILYPAASSELFAAGTAIHSAKAEIDAATPAGSCN